ncbi:hypothetical protein EK21DRAFT_89656 [Setomelanomma holmii]|uniref:Uncharacterized protein n=1 Tax=Setomelanomma holmii TaxID=210430 RepID=A0A9P4H7I2_9PLEO|nr:hypothetical protein EK21DRAFT_89656 [Setomelanomma holmii]
MDVLRPSQSFALAEGEHGLTLEILMIRAIEDFEATAPYNPLSIALTCAKAILISRPYAACDAVLSLRLRTYILNSYQVNKYDRHLTCSRLAASAQSLLYHLIVGTKDGQALYSTEMDSEARLTYWVQRAKKHVFGSRPANGTITQYAIGNNYELTVENTVQLEASCEQFSS